MKEISVTAESREATKARVVHALHHGAWGNYMAVHFLEWMSGIRKIESPKDMNIEPEDLPRLLEEARDRERECSSLACSLMCRGLEPAMIDQLNDLLKVQGSEGNWDNNEYMRGMFNGMELMVATVEGREPKLRSEAPSED